MFDVLLISADRRQACLQLDGEPRIDLQCSRYFSSRLVESLQLRVVGRGPQVTSTRVRCPGQRFAQIRQRVRILLEHVMRYSEPECCPRRIEWIGTHVGPSDVDGPAMATGHDENGGETPVRIIGIE